MKIVKQHILTDQIYLPFIKYFDNKDIPNFIEELKNIFHKFIENEND